MTDRTSLRAMRFRPLFALLPVLLGLVLAPSATAWESTRVVTDASGALTYPADAAGHRIVDFSNAGYRGGGIALPSVPVVKTLSATTGDQTARIQAALDEVGNLPVQADGYRGSLRLDPGTYQVDGTLYLRRSGVVLAGAGAGEDPTKHTILRRTGTSTAVVIQAGARDDSFATEVAGTRSLVTTPRVQVGSRTLEVDHPEYYRVGDPVVIHHPSTQAWIDAVDRGGVTDANTWKPGEIDLRYHRYVTALSGSTLTLDAPVFNHLDRSLSQAAVFRYNGSHLLTRVGIEQLMVDIVTAGELTEDHAEDAIIFRGVEDSWLRDCTLRHFVHAGVQFEGSTRCTVERCRSIEPHSLITGERRYNFSTYHAQLILFRDCFASYARHSFICNGTSLDSGIVVLDSVIDNPQTSAEGHRRWSTAILFDNVTTTNRTATSDVIGLYNRGTYGTGHGWAAAHSVAWACNATTAGKIVVQQPPTAQNYGIGCTGIITGTGPFAGPAGFIEGSNRTGLTPRSLYLAQLSQRQATRGRLVNLSILTPLGAGEKMTLGTVLGGAGTAGTRPLLVRAAGPSLIPLGVTATLPDPSLALVASATGATLARNNDWGNDATLAAAFTRLGAFPFAGPASKDAGIYQSALAAGSYSAEVSDPAGGAGNVIAELYDGAPGADFTAVPPRLINVSVLKGIATGTTLTAGFVIGGSTSRTVLVRAVGPSLGLAPFSVPGVMADPRLELFNSATGAKLAENNDWSTPVGTGATATQLAQAFADVGAFTLGAGTRDAALLATLPPGTYSAIVSAAAGAGGMTLIEVYEVP